MKYFLMFVLIPIFLVSKIPGRHEPYEDWVRRRRQPLWAFYDAVTLIVYVYSVILWLFICAVIIKLVGG